MKSVSGKKQLYNPGNRLSIDTSDSIFKDIVKIIDENFFDFFVMDLKALTVCDLYGISLLQKVESYLESKKIGFFITKPNSVIFDIIIESGHVFSIYS